MAKSKKMKITGKALHVRKEFIRCWTEATLTVLGLHNLRPQIIPGFISPSTDWTIRILDLSRHSVPLTGEMGIGGYCNLEKQEIGLEKTMSEEGMATAIVHEWIHAVEDWGDSNEKCCSTLTAKLKPLIAPLAENLMENYYRTAAYIAHTRKGMTYEVKLCPVTGALLGGDRYDDGQWVEVGAKDRFKESENHRAALRKIVDKYKGGEQ